MHIKQIWCISKVKKKLMLGIRFFYTAEKNNYMDFWFRKMSFLSFFYTLCFSVCLPDLQKYKKEVNIELECRERRQRLMQVIK